MRDLSPKFGLSHGAQLQMLGIERPLELDAGTLNQLEAEVHSAAQYAISSNSGSTPTPSAPASPTVRPAKRATVSPVSWKAPGQLSGNEHRLSVLESGTSSTPSTAVAQKLEFSVKSSGFSQVLMEVDVQNGATDGLLFEKICKAYQSTRKSLLPLRLRFNQPSAALYVKARSQILFSTKALTDPSFAATSDRTSPP